MAGVWVIAEQRDGEFRKVTMEALGAAQPLAAELGQELCCVVLGSGMADACESLGTFGTAKVLYGEDAELAQYSSEGYANALDALIKEHNPDLVIMGASLQGKDLAGRLAAKLGVSAAVDCTGLEIADGRVLATRPMYAGKVIAKVALKGPVQLISLRPNVFEPLETGGSAAVEAFTPQAGEIRAKVVDLKQEAEGKIELTEANIIVSGGRGMKGPENYAMLEELASVLGAAVGASRSAVDAGWRPHSDQVGQTGKVVTPNLYIACGISGAIQHLAGMGSSKVITAINKDPDAPIHGKADYSVVADLFDIVPPLIEEVKKLKEA
jgi:electron transfer flavoprotein alpha subunit